MQENVKTVSKAAIINKLHPLETNQENILITGAVSSAGEESIKSYEIMVQSLEQAGYNVFSPLDTMKFDGDSRQRYERAIKLINEASFVIAEVSTPSTGQGMELQIAIENGTPILAIAREGSKVSSLIIGSIGNILYYKSVEDILLNIIDFVKENSK